MSYGLGVDLGTISTAAAVCPAGRGRVEMIELSEQAVVAPAVVFAHPDGNLLTGDAAARRAFQSPDRVAREFKRRLGDPTPILLGGAPYSPAMLMAAGLRAALDRAAELQGGPPARVTLTYPAVWRTYRREQFEGVPALAGLTGPGVVTTVPEPVAAAAWYAGTHQPAPGDVVAVYDLGGGTFDAAVVRIGERPGDVEVLGEPEGVEWLGGVDFDEAVLAHADRATGGALSALNAADPRDAAVLIQVRAACTAAKESLSTDDEVTLVVPLASGDVRVRLTRAEFEALVRPMLTVTTETLARVLTSAGVRPADLAAVLLVGGSTRIPLVAALVEATVGRPVLRPEHPEQVVAAGAARLAGADAVAASTASVPSTGPTGVRAPRRPGLRVGGSQVGASQVRRLRAQVRRWGTRRTVTGLVAAGVLLALGIGAAAYAVGPSGHRAPDSAPAGDPVSSTAPPAPDVVVAGRIESIGAKPRDVTFSPDGLTAYVTSTEPDLIAVVDTAAGRVSDTIMLDAPPQDALTSPDGRRLYVTEPGAVVVIDPATGGPVGEIPAGPNPGRPALTPDGTLLLVPDQDDATLTIIDTALEQVRATVPLDGPSTAVAVTPDGRRAFAADAEDGLVSVIDMATGTLHGDPLRTGALPDAIAAGPGGVAVANYDAGTVSLIAPFPPAGPAVVAQLAVGENPEALAFAPDGRTLYVTDDATSSLLIVDTATRQLRATRPVGVGPVSVAVSRTGLVYVLNARDGTLSVLRAPGGPTPGKGEG